MLIDTYKLCPLRYARPHVSCIATFKQTQRFYSTMHPHHLPGVPEPNGHTSPKTIHGLHIVHHRANIWYWRWALSQVTSSMKLLVTEVGTSSSHELKYDTNTVTSSSAIQTISFNCCPMVKPCRARIVLRPGSSKASEQCKA